MVVHETTGTWESSDATHKYIRRIKINKRRTGKEFRVNTQVVGFQIKDTMLDLRSNVNIFPRKTWEALGRLKLTYSPIQLCMAKQYYIKDLHKLRGDRYYGR